MRRVRVLLIVLAVILVGAMALRVLGKPDVPEGGALVVTLRGAFQETASASLPAQLLGVSEASLLSALSELRKAERDPRIAHVVLRVRDLQIGWAKAQELRAQIRALSEAGRHPVAHLEIPGFGGNLAYYVASAADAVYVTPGSGAPLLGLAQEHYFLGGMWSKLGIELEVFQAGRFKSAVENLAGETMSEAYREQAESLLDSINHQFLDDIAASRSLARDDVETLLAAAPSEPAVLERLGVIDGVATEAELFEILGDPPRVTAQTYSAVRAEDVGFDPQAKLALVYASGAIVSGTGRSTRSGDPVVAADTVVEALQQAAADAEIRAIVLRVDSPGGAPGPSELIWRAVRRAREEKPVVASFSDYAASGGYYLASAADAIFASPGSITGSIGVFAVRPSLGEVFERLGIHAESSSRAPHADILALSRPLGSDTQAWLAADIAAVYSRFLDRVAEGRDTERAAIESVASGRVWTGAQAVDHGLVDGLGGMRTALDDAKQRAGLAPGTDAVLLLYPPPQPLADQIREALGARVADPLPHLPEVARRPLERLRGWLDAAAAPGPALVAPFWVEIR